MFEDHGRRLGERANAGMVAGFVLFCLSLLALLVCCCCFRDRSRKRDAVAAAALASGIGAKAASGGDATGAFPTASNAARAGFVPGIVETDSSGSENMRDDAAIGLFHKGRQAGMAEGLRDEPMDAYAVGYMDGAHYADERKEVLTDAQVMKQAKKLGYTGASGEGYTRGFQLGVRDGLSTEVPEQRDAYAAGLLNAEARGLTDGDRDAYGYGYAAGENSGLRYDSNEELTARAQSEGFNGPLSDIFSAGYNDGVDGINVTDILSPSAAFQKGLGNASALGLSEDDAVAHASGFQDGYAYALLGDNSEPLSKAEMTVKAAEAGFTGDAAKLYCSGFDEGVDEGTASRNRVFLKGYDRAEGLGMSGNYSSAFANGYKDGSVYSATGNTVPTDTVLKSSARGLNIKDDDETTSYIRGFKEGHKLSSSLGGPIKEILLPEAILEKSFVQSQQRNNDSETSTSFASGSHDGYCFGLNGGTMKSEKEILAMADKLRFEGYDADIYASGFKEGIIEGNAARDAVFMKGKARASSLGMSGESASVYANGYCDGNSGVISGEESNVLSESSVKKQAKKLGTSRQLIPFYVNGYQDGQRDGFEYLSRGHILSKEASYAKGLLDGKSDGMSGEVSHAHATGYSEGYSRGLNGGAAVSEEDLRESGVELGFDSKKTQKTFIKGFTVGHTDGLDARKKQTDRVLSPTAALERGVTSASTFNLKGESAKGHSDGFAEGYSVGLAGYQCPSDEKLTEKTRNLGFSADSRPHFVHGFKEGHKEGAAGSVNKNVVGLNPDAALTRGTEKAEIHGMRGGISKAYAHGYQDGYSVGLDGSQRQSAGKSSENNGSGNARGGSSGRNSSGYGAGYGSGGNDGYIVGRDGLEDEDRDVEYGYDEDPVPADKAEISRDELGLQAKAHGYTDKRHVHAYIAGYLAGQSDGGAVVLHHSLCDVHRCTSAYCETCRNMKTPKFLAIPQGYQHNNEQWADKLWWDNKD